MSGEHLTTPEAATDEEFRRDAAPTDRPLGSGVVEEK